MEILIDCLWIVLGLALLWFGANWLVSSASGLARRLRLSEAVIGGTVVALGTSMPELVSTCLAAIRGNAGIAFGTIVGSNICNILLILGLSSVIRKRGKPLRAPQSVVNHDGGWLVASICVLGLLAASHFGISAEEASAAKSAGGFVMTRLEGFILLIFFGGFMATTLLRALRDRLDSAKGLIPAGEMEGAVHAALSSAVPSAPHRKWYVEAEILVAALALLAVGADRLVTGAASLAMAAGIPELVVGLTIVAVGTSMPELATSVIASRQGKDELSITNITGSNIQNILVCLGLAVVLVPGGILVLEPVSPASTVMRDYWVMAVATVFLLFTLSWSNRLGRVWGWLALAGYGGYVWWLVSEVIAMGK